MKVKISSIMTVITLILLIGCSDKKDSNNVGSDEAELENVEKEGMPIVKEPITLDFFAGQTPQTNDDWNDVLIFNEYEDMTNIDINWEMVPAESLD